MDIGEDKMKEKTKMNKAVLVIDMPDCCGDCPICASYAESAHSIREYWCVAYENKDVDPNSKPNWCPLKIAPKIQTGYNYIDEEDAWIKGYNNCVREIIGK